jgi:hypothetical protein
MCGSPAEVRDPHGMDMFQVRCTDGYCRVNDPHNFDTAEDAIEAWNTRPIEDGLRAEIARLKEQNEYLNADNGKLAIENVKLKARLGEAEEYIRWIRKCDSLHDAVTKSIAYFAEKKEDK